MRLRAAMEWILHFPLLHKRIGNLRMCSYKSDFPHEVASAQKKLSLQSSWYRSVIRDNIRKGVKRMCRLISKRYLEEGAAAFRVRRFWNSMPRMSFAHARCLQER